MKNLFKSLLTILIIVFIFNIIIPSLNAAPLENADTQTDTQNEGENTSDLIKKKLNNTAGTNGAGYKNNNLVDTVANITRIILSFIGIFFLIIIIMGGFQWMSAGGNEEKVNQAKTRIKNGTVGLAVIILSYAISMFIMAFFFAVSTT